MSRAAAVLIAGGLCVGWMATGARADAPPAAPAPSPAPAPTIDVQDLPPLPAPEVETARATAVASAADTEEDVVTGAAKREQSLGNVASAVTVISADRLRRFGYRTVAEALRGVAGLFIDDDHISSRLGIRGLQVLGDFNTRVLVLIDGATVNEPWDQFAGLDWDLPVAIDDVERIEVIRGPVSSVYGTNAFLGIINIITRGAAESPHAWGRITTSSFGEIAEAAGFAQGDVNHQIRGTVSALYRGGESITRDLDPSLGPTQLADGMTGYNAALVGTYEGAFAQVRAYRRLRDLTYAPYDTLPGSRDTHNLDEQVMTEGGYAHTFGKLELTARAYVQRYHFADYLVSAFAGQPPFEDTGDSFWYGSEVRGRYALLDRDRLGITAGTEVTRQDTRSRSHYADLSGQPVDIPNTFLLGGFYAEADARPLPWLAATGGVRFDANTVLDNNTSPRAAVFFSNGDRYGLKLLYAEGFRNPSAYEAFFFDNMSFEKPAHIASETIRSYEAVLWDRPVPGLSLRLSAFRWRTQDQIGQGPSLDGQPLIEFQNLGSLTSTGLEAEGSYRTASGWFGFAGGAYAAVGEVDALGADEVATNAPPFTGSLGVSTPKLWGVAHASTELLYVGAEHTRMDGVDSAPWVGWNAAIYVPDLRRFDVTLGVRNLIGRRQQVVASDDFDRQGGQVIEPIAPGEGREWFARVGYRY